MCLLARRGSSCSQVVQRRGHGHAHGRGSASRSLCAWLLRDCDVTSTDFDDGRQERAACIHHLHAESRTKQPRTYICTLCIVSEIASRDSRGRSPTFRFSVALCPRRIETCCCKPPRLQPRASWDDPRAGFGGCMESGPLPCRGSSSSSSIPDQTPSPLRRRRGMRNCRHR